MAGAAKPSLAALVNDISDCLEALENETSTQGSAGDAVAERMRTLLPALLDTTDGATPDAVIITDAHAAISHSWQ